MKNNAMTKFRGSTLKTPSTAGFTLAEVLITLGIIGVVAAMTIPTLIANTNIAKYRAGFKKGISTLNQAVRMNVANYDWDFAGIDTDNSCGGSGKLGASDDPATTKSMCALLNGNLKGYTYLGNLSYDMGSTVYGQELYNVMDANGGQGGFWASTAWLAVYQLSDGMVIGMYRHPGCAGSSASCPGFIDVNGMTLPNKMVQCDDPGDTGLIVGTSSVASPCTVTKQSSMNDIFPIGFYDSTVVPATNAAQYVLNTAK